MEMSRISALAVVLLLSAALVYTNAEAAAQEDELALTPFGYWPAACVHSAESACTQAAAAGHLAVLEWARAHMD
jgi:hypothetical protein